MISFWGPPFRCRKSKDQELEDLEKAINVSANNLTLSISLSANLVQEGVESLEKHPDDETAGKGNSSWISGF